ncbi:hypothetical protein LSTR_LSTR014879 [Laodelphax striatellus]|uniref:Uncharacterized protein n=1 Tax=Laodelphax striatellus TaxID=195883 RepID=A0A482WNC1_LAOST|nr:hypothetical protein LSTR_LSTR014879 [Laodelphax striatellus]
MQMCWNEEPTRPSLDHVIAMLKHLQMSRTSDSDDNFERRWEKLKPNTIPVTDNQTSSDALTVRSDFDSGVDLDLKTNSDHDLKSSALDLKSVEFGGSNSSSHFGTNSSSHFDINSSQSVLEASNSDIRTSSSEFDCKLKGSPQLSVASSLGGDYFAAQLARQLSPSLTNLRGSFEDVVATDDVVTGPSQHKPSFDFITTTNLQPSDTDQFDSWLQGVDTTDEEEVNMNALRSKRTYSCAQQIPRDQDEDNSPEEEQQRADMVIEYGSYPVPLSPIMEEGESVSSNQSSIILDLHSSNVSSGKSSPVMMMLDRNDSFDDEEAGRRFEEDIRTALDLYSSDSIESDEVVDIIVEDLEGREGETRKVRGENKEEEEEDLLIVNTETNEAQLLESPRPKSHLAFVRKSKIEKNLSPMNGTNTYTPDSISPISTGSSRTGVALSFSSPDTGGNLSSFLSPSNSENVDSEYSVNNSLDLDVVAKDLKSVPNFFDHKEMFDKLKELEEESSSDTSEMSSERTISVPGKSVLEDGRKEFAGEKTDQEKLFQLRIISNVI